MARVSRKAAAMEQEARIISKPERVYSTAVYARLSVEDNNRAGDRESITMQRYMLEKYVEAQADMRLSGVFCDNGETGTNFERPEFERLMDGIRGRMIDCIVVKDLSRFGRNYVETGYYLEKIFPYLGVRFVAVNDNYDSIKDKDGNELVISLKNLVKNKRCLGGGTTKGGFMNFQMDKLQVLLHTAFTRPDRQSGKTL